MAQTIERVLGYFGRAFGAEVVTEDLTSRLRAKFAELGVNLIQLAGMGCFGPEKAKYVQMTFVRMDGETTHRRKIRFSANLSIILDEVEDRKPKTAHLQSADRRERQGRYLRRAYGDDYGH